MTLPKRSEGPPAIPSWCRVGAKVVCVDAPAAANINYKARSRIMPVVGCVYTVNDLGEAIAGVIKTAWIGLAELDQDIAYSVQYFRPVYTLEADLEAHFSQLLHVPSTHTVDA